MNLGSCPVPTIISPLTKKGGNISLYPFFLVCKSSIKFISALSRDAPRALFKKNLEPDNLLALSKSRIPKFSPISQWGFISKSNFLISPNFLISTLLFSSRPIGTVS